MGLSGFSTEVEFLGKPECSEQQHRFNFRILKLPKMFLKR